MKTLSLFFNGYTLQFVSVSGESRSTFDANIFNDAWQSSLTVAVMEAEEFSMNGLILSLQALLKSGFDGWIIADAERLPNTLTSFRIHQAGEDSAVKEALLVCTIGFKANLPKELK